MGRTERAERGPPSRRSPSRKSGRGAKKKEEEVIAKQPFPGPDGKHYIDAAVFVVVMVVAAIIAYALIPVAFSADGAGGEEDLGDVATNVNLVLMGSTIPKTSYTNNQNVRTEYHDAKVHYLLTEDLYIRTEGKRDLSLSSLRTGMEKSVADQAAGLLPEGYGFVITVTGPEQAGFAFVRPGPDDDTIFDADHQHKTINDILGSKNGDSFKVSSQYQLRGGELCTITFTLFLSSAYDTGSLGGA